MYQHTVIFLDGLSIPIRFNYNSTNVARPGRKGLLSIPIRFNYNAPCSPATSSSRLLSIPIRFNYNWDFDALKEIKKFFQFQ